MQNESENRQEQDLLILTGMMPDSFETDDGTRDVKQKIADYRHCAENCNSNQAG